jgi:acyl-CoA reductase-like NAD-dependent aldehyde dehydrogenase
MAEDLKLYIGGEWTEGTGSEVHELISPVTGEHIANLPIASEQDVDRAVGAAREALRDLAEMSVFDRAETCHRIAELIRDNDEELARIQTLEQGKPFKAESLPEMDESAELFELAAEDMKRLKGDVINTADRSKRIFTFRRPVGVWATITPWNFPLMIPCEYLGPGLASGNALVLKPPEVTPWTVLKFAELLEEAGVPKGAVSVLPGGASVGEAMVTHSGVDGIGFTGSSKTGERIVSIAGLKRTFMEMSGNGPLIVLDDADVAAAAEAAVSGAAYSSGQVCVATERAIVVDPVHDEFVAATLKAAEQIRLGDPFDDDTTMGPLNNEPTAQKMDRHIADARERGAEILLGGGRADGFPTRLYYEFTVADGVPPDSVLAREESFGPVVPVISARDDEEALLIANADELGLSSAVWTSSLKRAFWFADRLRSGNVIVNDGTDYWDSLEPFGGGAGTRSGWGRIGGEYSIHDMTDIHTVVIDVDKVRAP